MIRYATLFFLLLTSNFLFSADYKTLSLSKARELSYKTSDCIFMGIPKNIDENIVEFSVAECFKGDIGEEVIVKFHDPGTLDNVFSLWLIYGYLKDDTVIINGPLNRSLDNPFIIGVSEQPTNVVVDENDEYIVFEENSVDKKWLENKWRNEFYDEIMILRCLNEKTSNVVIPEFTHEGEFANFFMILNVILNILTIILLLLLLRKPRGK